MWRVLMLEGTQGQQGRRRDKQVASLLLECLFSVRVI